MIDAADPIWARPTRLGAAWFQARVGVQVLRRLFRDFRTPAVRRFCPSEQLKDAPVITTHRTPLWHDGREDEFELVAGKVHNLRIARPSFHGIVVPAGSVFSFWRQLGRPSRLRGFVEGREIRAGCVVPTIAGGLCQLSNALATCALRGSMTWVERHGHTARIEAGAIPGEMETIDATVFWNYVDLQFVATFDFRIEVELTSDELVVRMRAKTPRPLGRKPLASVPVILARHRTPVARGCSTCDETGCFRHRERAVGSVRGLTAILVNRWTPEFSRHLHGQGGPAEWFVPWLRPSRRRSAWWDSPAPDKSTVAIVASLRRTLLLRKHAGEGAGRQAAVLSGDQWIADSYARGLLARHTHLVIDQSLLVPLAQSGALGGRTYDVLMHSLPAHELQRRLDAAARRWPEDPSLSDFRVSQAHCDAEMQALSEARRLVTPHADVARYLLATAETASIEMIDWTLPVRQAPYHRLLHTKPTVVFPASALARKGVLEIAEAARRLRWRLLVLGTPSNHPQLWDGIDVAHVPYSDSRWLSEADVVALPAYVEHAPRGLLTAIAHGIPVVASHACGLPAAHGAIEVNAGDIGALIAALQQAVDCRHATRPIGNST